MTVAGNGLWRNVLNKNYGLLEEKADFQDGIAWWGEEMLGIGREGNGREPNRFRRTLLKVNRHFLKYLFILPIFLLLLS